MNRFIRLCTATIFVAAGCASTRPTVATAPAVALSYAEQPDCRVKSVEKSPDVFENAIQFPNSERMIVTQLDAQGVYQAYAGTSTNLSCLTCTARPGGPRVDRNKPMLSVHPSGQWVAVGVEEDSHANEWFPRSWQRGLIQSGIWLNIWLMSPDGEKWYQITDFRPANGPSDGYVGISFTPDGTKAVWAEIVNGNVFVYPFGLWKLYIADFNVNPAGVPALTNKRDITPPGVHWAEPGNFSPDGRHLLLSLDKDLKDPRGQDQWSLDIVTGELRNLTRTPAVWDEHGLYSRDGKKISFMSSYPYRDDPKALQTNTLKTEFMLMDADGSHLQQLTHFNVPGYPESQATKTIAAVAGFFKESNQMLGTVMAEEFKKTNWLITFEGPCGGR